MKDLFGFVRRVIVMGSLVTVTFSSSSCESLARGMVNSLVGSDSADDRYSREKKRASRERASNARIRSDGYSTY